MGTQVEACVTCLVQEADEVLAAAGLLQLADCFRLNLANAFASHFEDVADFFQCVAVTITQTIAQFDDLAFAVAQRLEDVSKAVAEHLLASANGWAFSGSVRQQVTELAVFAVALIDLKLGPIQTNRIAAHG